MSILGLDKDLRRFKNGKRKLMKDLADNSKKFFQITNFNAQAFVDVPRKKWKKLKVPRPGLILVKTGAMRASGESRVQSSTRATVKFKAKYSSFHNQGTAKLPKRQFSGESKVLNKQNDKIILNYTKRKLR